MQGGLAMKITALKEIIAKINEDTGMQIIKGNTKNTPPAYPYGMYLVTSPYIRGTGKGVVTQYTDGIETFEKREEQYKFTVSLSFYGEDNETAIDRAMKVHQWFLFLGQAFITEKNLAVVSVGNIGDRTTFIVDDYEYKHGFDVQFRALDEQVRKLTEVIETIT
jgi:hypothetical protein